MERSNIRYNLQYKRYILKPPKESKQYNLNDVKESNETIAMSAALAVYLALAWVGYRVDTAQPAMKAFLDVTLTAGISVVAFSLVDNIEIKYKVLKGIDISKKTRVISNIIYLVSTSYIIVVTIQLVMIILGNLHQ